jgi:hypothetical protein
MHAIPNGGKRDKITGARMKAEGVLSGVFDIFLPVARNGYHGMYIEMKARSCYLSQRQNIFRLGVQQQGYKAIVCFSWINAKDQIELYLNCK